VHSVLGKINYGGLKHNGLILGTGTAIWWVTEPHFFVFFHQFRSFKTFHNPETQGGPGLAFIVYPEIVNRIGSGMIGNIFSALFFLMLVTLALGSIFGAFETILSALCDQVSML
jgi:SNF family Na+-dependent transporter